MHSLDLIIAYYLSIKVNNTWLQNSLHLHELVNISLLSFP